MFFDESVLQIVFIGERPVAVVDVNEATKRVVAVVNLLPIGQRLDQQTAGGIPVIFGDQFATVIAEFGFLQQLAVEVVFVRGAAAVEAGFLLNQPVAVVIKVVVLAALVFDFTEQQARVVVAVAQLAAVGIDAAADEVQVVGVFVAGDTAELVAFVRDRATDAVYKCGGGPPSSKLRIYKMLEN